MINLEFQERIVENKDWATLLFVFAFVLILVTKSAFENRFSEFSKLVISDKYTKIYKDGSNLMSWFTVILFFVQLISLAFFIQMIFNYFGYISKTDWVVYVRILTFLGVFILCKYLIEKIIGTAFKIEEFVEQFNLQKVSYRTYVGIVLLPLNIIMFYNNNIPIAVIYVAFIAVLVINGLTYFKSLKIYQNLIFTKIIYFILYLCALEIAPYYFIYYWFTRS